MEVETRVGDMGLHVRRELRRADLQYPAPHMAFLGPAKSQALGLESWFCSQS